MRKNIKLSGKVVSGRSRSSEDISQSEERINKIIGAKLYLGTLNLVLEKPIMLTVSQGHSFDDKRRYLWRVSGPDQSLPLYIYRWIGCPLHIVELISTVKLRTVHELNEGSTFQIGIDPDYVLPVSIEKYLAWFFLWKGRTSWYYKKETYKEKVYRCNRLRRLASQKRV